MAPFVSYPLLPRVLGENSGSRRSYLNAGHGHWQRKLAIEKGSVTRTLSQRLPDSDMDQIECVASSHACLT